jgi:hypothetical protein
MTTCEGEITFERTVQSLDRAFKETWNELTPLKQKALIAVLRGKGHPGRIYADRSSCSV